MGGAREAPTLYSSGRPQPLLAAKLGLSLYCRASQFALILRQVARENAGENIGTVPGCHMASMGAAASAHGPRPLPRSCMLRGTRRRQRSSADSIGQLGARALWECQAPDARVHRPPQRGSPFSRVGSVRRSVRAPWRASSCPGGQAAALDGLPKATQATDGATPAGRFVPSAVAILG